VTGWINKTHVGDCRELLRQMAADGVRVQTCVTSPPYYGLRDYGVAGQIGLEPTPAEYVDALVAVFRGVRELLADDGTAWVNLGDSYYSPRINGGIGKNSTINGQGSQEAFRDAQRSRRSPKQLSNVASAHATAANRRHGLPNVKPKDLLGIPWRVAFALQADGWYLRNDIIWSKPNGMPESVTDRCTKSHEYIFLLAKAQTYYFDQDAIKEPADPANFRTSDPAARWIPEGQAPHTGFRNGRQYEARNKRTVWTVPPAQFPGAHFATFPRALIEPCILAGSKPGDTVLDPFIGSGTTEQVGIDLGRKYIGCEINPKYVELREMRRTTIGMPI
jgi:DNA modification methylase